MNWNRINLPIALCLSCVLVLNATAAEVIVPAGTSVLAELDQQVISKKRKFNVGDIVRAHVWRNVVVDGKTVIKAGAPLTVRISHLKTAKVAGIKGDLELEAVSVRGIDNSEILLDGGYDKSGKGRKALSITMFALVAWPLIFIKGKNAQLGCGHGLRLCGTGRCGSEHGRQSTQGHQDKRFSRP